MLGTLRSSPSRPYPAREKQWTPGAILDLPALLPNLAPPGSMSAGAATYLEGTGVQASGIQLVSAQVQPLQAGQPTECVCWDLGNLILCRNRRVAFHPSLSPSPLPGPLQHGPEELALFLKFI